MPETQAASKKPKAPDSPAFVTRGPAKKGEPWKVYRLAKGPVNFDKDKPASEHRTKALARAWVTKQQPKELREKKEAQQAEDRKAANEAFERAASKGASDKDHAAAVELARKAGIRYV